jgi:endoglucanase
LEELQDEIEWLRQNYMPQCEIWQTETGYDQHPESMFAPAPLPGKSVDVTVATFEVRTALLYAAKGIDHLFWYMTLDVAWAPGPYESSGLFDNNFNPRLKTIYLQRLRELLGEYRFTKWVGRFPRIAEFDFNGVKRYAAWHPTREGKTSIYNPGRT